MAAGGRSEGWEGGSGKGCVLGGGGVRGGACVEWVESGML